MSWIGRSFRALVDRLSGASPATTPGAAEVLAALRSEKQVPADPERWRAARARFVAQVFSGADRERIWKRARRRYGHPARPWEPSHPSATDLDCLQDILRDLGR